MSARDGTVTVNVERKTQVARPLKILVPLIKDELRAADEAGLEHYRRAGEMLNEAKGQVAHGSWVGWLSKNFELSKRTAQRYMRLASATDDGDDEKRHGGAFRTLSGSIGERPARAAWQSVAAADLKRLADERQTRDNEIKLHRDLALELVDIGYKTLATKLHPDRGGSRDAMARLNSVRDRLKAHARRAVDWP